MPYLPLAPWHWEHGSLSLGKPLAQLSLAFQGSKDCNPRSATPSDVRGNRRIIMTPSKVVAKQRIMAAFGASGIARYKATALCVMARFPVSLTWAGTYLSC